MKFKLLAVLAALALAPFSRGQSLLWKDINGLPSVSMLREGAAGKIFAVSNQYIFSSTDRGRAWQRSPSSNGIVQELASRGSVQAMWREFQLFSAPYQVFLSVDNGVTWNRIFYSRFYEYDHFALSDSGTLYGQVWASVAYRSYRIAIARYSAGRWDTLGNPTFMSPDVMGLQSVMMIDHSGNIFIGTNVYGMVYSTDNCVTWKKTLPYRSINALNITPSNQVIVGASPTGISQGGKGGGVFVSSDQGTTWVGLGLKDQRISAVAGDSAGNYYASTGTGVYRYSPAAASWELIGPSTQSFSDVLVSSQGDVFTTNQISLYRSSDAGESWIASGPRDRGIFSLTVDSAGGIYAGTLGNRTFVSQDDGATWLQADAGAIPDNIFSLATTGSRVYAGTDQGLYVSSDAGSTWQDLTGSALSGAVYAVSQGPGGGIYIGTNFGVYTSSDLGTSWALSGLQNSSVLFLAADASVIYAAAGNGVLFRSLDAGQTWNPTPVQRDDIQCITIGPDGTVYVGVFGGVMISHDGGVSWIPRTFTTGYVYAVAADGGQRVFAGTYTGVMASYDGGLTWGSAGLAYDSFLSLALDSRQHLFAGSTDDGLYETTQSVATSVETPRATLPLATRLSQNYPNPFNPSTRIAFQLARAEQVELSVYDILGREVTRLVEGPLQPGEYTEEWNAARQPAGVYFVRLLAGSFRDVKKILLVK